MIVLGRHGLVILAVPKTGSTALRAALRPETTGTGGPRHLTAQGCLAGVLPRVAAETGRRPEMAAVLRHPVDRLESWWRYRRRPEVRPGHSTARVTLDAFLAETLKPDPAPWARIGSQERFCSGASGRLIVDHLFAYERPESLLTFLGERLGREVTPPRRNVSPPVPARADPDLVRRVLVRRAGEYLLWQRVAAAGHLHMPQDR